jgi:precorrin-6x reductase
MEMTPTSAYSMAVAGILSAGHALDEDAARVAADPTDISALVDSTVQPYAVAANAAALRAARETDQHLFDAWA